MKRLFAWALACLAGFFPVRAEAAELADPCDRSQERPWCEYQNLSLYQQDMTVALRWPNAPDPHAFLLPSKASPGKALYAVSGAERVTVALYSLWSTVAGESGDGVWMLGLGVPGTYRRPKLSGSRIYLQTEQGWRTMYRDQLGQRLFLEPAAAPSASAPDYGPTVDASRDGGSDFGLSPVFARIRNGVDEGGDMTVYYEVYTCTVPAGINFIQVELNEAAVIPLEEGGTYPSPPGSMLLAEVRFEGQSVRTGSFPSDESSSAAPSPSSDPDLQPSVPPSSSEKPPVPKRVPSSSSSSKASSRSSSKTTPSSSSSGRAGAASPAEPSPKSSPHGADSSQSPARPPEILQSSPRQEGNGGTMLAAGGYMLTALVVLAFISRKK